MSRRQRRRLGWWFHFVEPDGAVGFWVNPNEGVIPSIRELDLNEVVAPGASWSSCLENRVRALAVAVNVFQQNFSALIPRDSGWAASFAEGFHFLYDEV
jgi:hypothetical protein